MKQFDLELQPGEHFEMGPGDTMVVGPKGKFVFFRDMNGRYGLHMNQCQFIGPGVQSKAKSAFVDEAWSNYWNDLGDRPKSGSGPDDV